MSQNFENLVAHILPLSRADDFETARNEWKLYDIELSVEWDNCPCGQDIKEICYIRNQLNGKETYVGNVCVNRFLGMDTGNIFDGLKRIISDPSANPNEDLIIYAYRQGYITDKDYHFSMDTRKKRKLSGPQLSWKRDINRRILNQVSLRRPRSTRT